MNSAYIYMTCQHGAESTLKAEIFRERKLRFAFSQPGFLTFKTNEENHATLCKLVKSCRRMIFSRQVGISVSKIDVPDAVLNPNRQVEEQCDVYEFVAEQIVRKIAEHPFLSTVPLLRFHAWSRDLDRPGEQDFEPGQNVSDHNLHHRIMRKFTEIKRLAPCSNFPDLPAARGETVVDCIQVRDNSYWLGYHQVSKDHDEQQLWPGGIAQLLPPLDFVSRAWYKFEEALRWSRLPIHVGARCLDVGAAPGGASQALLARGAEVIGLDPGQIHPIVLNHPNFTYLRGRTGKVKMRNFRKIRWIVSDMNVTPNYTLQVIEDLVRHPELRIRGLLFTLKLFQWKQASSVVEYLEVLRNLGFNKIMAKQLAFNRQEIMVAAQKVPFQR